MKKRWIFLILFINLTILISVVLYYKTIIANYHVNIHQYDGRVEETEDRFIVSYSLELGNPTNEDYHMVIPEFLNELGDLKNINSINYFDLKAKSSVLTTINFSLYKIDLTEEQIEMIREVEDKIVTHFILGQRLSVGEPPLR